MDGNQMSNIVGFVFNLHKQCDINWEKESPDYIMEKWNKYIGTKTISNLFDLESLSPRSKAKTKHWIRIWNVSDSKFHEMKEIVYLINIINTKAILQPIDNSNIRYWNLEELIDLFSKVIDIEKVNKEFYNHQHTLVKREVVKWLNRTENKRAYNLNLLV
jgi:hypothetical protein